MQFGFVTKMLSYCAAASEIDIELHPNKAMFLCAYACICSVVRLLYSMYCKDANTHISRCKTYMSRDFRTWQEYGFKTPINLLRPQ